MNDHLIRHPPDLATSLLRLAQKCAACTSSQDFADLVRNELRQVLPHTSLIAAMGRIDLEHLELLHVEAVDYPPAGLHALQRQTNLRNRPALARWLSTRIPIVLDTEVDGARMTQAERQEVAHMQVGRVAAHGVFDLAARSGSYFTFGGLPRIMTSQDVSRLLPLLVPHLHQALAGCHHSATELHCTSALLTDAEREVMRWVAAGRTNAEIAQLRGRSEATVRNQLTATYRKLGVCNRAAAVRLQREWS